MFIIDFMGYLVAFGECPALHEPLSAAFATMRSTAATVGTRFFDKAGDYHAFLKAIYRGFVEIPMPVTTEKKVSHTPPEKSMSFLKIMALVPVLILLGSVSAGPTETVPEAPPAIFQKNARILFQGDSITDRRPRTRQPTRIISSATATFSSSRPSSVPPFPSGTSTSSTAGSAATPCSTWRNAGKRTPST